MTCSDCEALRVELATLRVLAGVKEVRVAALMSWWGIGQTAARIALRLYDTRGPVSVAQLSCVLPVARNRRAVAVHIYKLRREMDCEAIDTLENAYELTEVGRAEVERALAP